MKKQDYLNKVNATGVLEAIKNYSINCPGLRTDATVVYLIPEGTAVEKGDTICILEATEIENAYKEALRNLDNTRADYNITMADLNLQYIMLESQVKTIEAQTTISKLDSTQMDFVSEYSRQIIKLEIEKAEIEKEKIESKLHFLKRINEFELKKMEAKIKQEENKVAIEKEKLDKLVLKSDVPGMVVYERLWTSDAKIREGDIVWWQMPIAKIPDMSEMQVKLIVNDTKYKQIEKGQSVHIRVDAFPEILLTGKVIKKTPMGKPIKKGSKIKEFEIYCKIDTLDMKLQPGLSVTCDVIVESIPDTLVLPMCAIFEKDSIKIVYIQEEGLFCPKPVQIAKNNASYAIITDGLSEKEIIALSEPPDAWIKHKEE